MTECPRCKSVKVIMDHTKDGYPYLRNYGANHSYTCPAGKPAKLKKKEKAARPKVRKARDELMSLGLSRDEADKIIKAHPGASDDELVMEALREKEKMALKAMGATDEQADRA